MHCFFSRRTGVGHHDEDCVGGVLDELGDDALEDVGVPLHEGQPRLPLLLSGSCRHDANPGAGCDGVVGAGVNFHVPGA